MAYKRELIAQTKNLLSEIKPFSNTKVENGIVYQGIADTREFDSLKVQIYNGDTFVKNWGGNNQQIGKNTLTFTTDVLPTHTRVIFGLNGMTNDTTVFTPITLENNTTYTLSMDFINITQGEIAWTNSMLEKNSTATDYVPYGHLSSYKKLLKVSDVCQLMDKREYPATNTVNGVTYTNNGDGLVILSGTATGQSSYILIRDIGMAGHRYLVFGCPVGGSYNTYRLTASIYKNGSWLDGFSDDGNGNISKVLEEGESIGISIDVKNISDANLVFKPQLFDLTEMYGAGNEPKTVAEFKAKFPNELYDYSPRCWVKSYKTGLIAETKNLFNINALTPYTPETLPFHTAGVYNGNIIARAVDGSSVCFSGKTLQELCPDIQAGVRYTFSFKTNGTGSQANTIYLWDGAAIANGENNLIDANDLNREVCFYANYPEITVATISNFQIEKGTTVTDYVPYGYL